MSDTDHLKVFHRGVDAWNRWRRKNRSTQPDLSHADLRQTNLRLGNLNNANLRYANLEGANLGRAYLESAELEGAQQRGIHLFGADLGRAVLCHADLGEAQLWHARLEEARLDHANLKNADLRYADLSGTSLEGACLSATNLQGVGLFRADLRDTDCRGARFHRAQVWNCRFDGADWTGAVMAHTVLNNLDLSRVRGLDEIVHEEPLSIGVDTLELTALGLARDDASSVEIETFLRRAGIRESFLDVFRQRVAEPFEFYSAFIRYSHADQAFAHRLYEELQGHGVRCWLHEHPMLAGDDVHESVDLGPWDRLLLCTSEAACTSWWIDSELSHVAEKENRSATGNGAFFLPVSLDGYPASGDWEGRAAEHTRPRLMADFTGWSEEDDTFERGLEGLMKGLRVRPEKSP